MVERIIAPSDAPLLDHLYDLAGCDDDAFAADMLTAFLYSSTESLQALGIALKEQNLAQVARVAHRLKSSFSTLAMAQGTAACADLEEAARSGDLRATQQTADTVRALRALEAARAARLLAILT